MQLGIDYEWEFITISGGPAQNPSIYPSNPLAPWETLNDIVFADAGVYNIRHRVKSDCCGWSAWELIILNVEPIPDFTILPNPAYLCGSGTVTLTVVINNPASVDPTSILWTPATGLSSPTSLSPTVSALISTTTYTVFAFNPVAELLCGRNRYRQRAKRPSIPQAPVNPANCGSQWQYYYQQRPQWHCPIHLRLAAPRLVAAVQASATCRGDVWRFGYRQHDRLYSLTGICHQPLVDQFTGIRGHRSQLFGWRRQQCLAKSIG